MHDGVDMFGYMHVRFDAPVCMRIICMYVVALMYIHQNAYSHTHITQQDDTNALLIKLDVPLSRLFGVPKIQMTQVRDIYTESTCSYVYVYIMSLILVYL
jgi:hypothetical protein